MASRPSRAAAPGALWARATDVLVTLTLAPQTASGAPTAEGRAARGLGIGDCLSAKRLSRELMHHRTSPRWKHAQTDGLAGLCFKRLASEARALALHFDSGAGRD